MKNKPKTKRDFTPADFDDDGNMRVSTLVALAGTQYKLSQITGAHRQALRIWKKIPSTRVRAVSEWFDIPKYLIRPDIYIKSEG